MSYSYLAGVAAAMVQGHVSDINAIYRIQNTHSEIYLTDELINKAVVVTPTPGSEY